MDSISSFFSSAVRAYTEDDVAVIGFGNDEISPTNFIIITRYDDPGAPELPREDMIGIQTSDSNREISAAISRISLSRKTIEIEILEARAVELGGRWLRTQFDVDDDEYINLKNYIELICADTRVSLTTRSIDR